MTRAVALENSSQRSVFMLKERTIFHRAFPIIIALFVYLRMRTADYGFSYDYGAYLRIMDVLSGLSFSEMLGEYLTFPYIYTQGLIPVEIGFGLLVKTISLTGASPQATIAIIAAFSVGLRMQVMQSLGMPPYWNILINVLAITLMEANALRLGLSVSVLLLGLRNIYWRRHYVGFLAIALSVTFHFQAVLFCVPFTILYIITKNVKLAKARLVGLVIFITVVELFAIKLIPFLAVDKLQDYAARGSSNSAGLSITSGIALFLFGSTVAALQFKGLKNVDSNFFSIITAASLPSLILLITLTEVAVLGDRAWQLAFIMFAAFFFINWSETRSKLVPMLFLITLTTIILINVLLRFPLSNFFSPPVPHFIPYVEQGR